MNYLVCLFAFIGCATAHFTADLPSQFTADLPSPFAGIMNDKFNSAKQFVDGVAANPNLHLQAPISPSPYQPEAKTDRDRMIEKLRNEIKALNSASPLSEQQLGAMLKQAMMKAGITDPALAPSSGSSTKGYLMFVTLTCPLVITLMVNLL
jgi:hypothetical protein